MENSSFSNELKSIELTEKQRERAETLYTNLCTAIQEEGLDIDFYAQGSFAIKTAVRPYKNDANQSYDVDVICEFNNYSKQFIDADDLTNKLVETMDKVCHAKGKTYEVFDRCVTVEYADDESGVSFSIDVIPAVRESDSTLSELMIKTERADLVDTSIAISGDKSANDWIMNNPKGYKAWFEESSSKFQSDYIEYRGLKMDSIEGLPEDKIPSNMLRNSIKMLKRLRDIFYSRHKAKSSSPSIILTTIVTKLSTKLIYIDNETEFLKAIIEQLIAISMFAEKGESYRSTYQGLYINDIVTRENKNWVLMNPANGNDNVLSSWNEDNNAAKEFFAWLDDLRDFLDMLVNTDMTEVDKNIQIRSAIGLKLENTENKIHNVPSTAAHPWRR